MERTLSIIKPDAVSKNVIGEIYTFFEKNNLKIIAAKMMHLSEEEAGGFYSIHKEKPFFKKVANSIGNRAGLLEQMTATFGNFDSNLLDIR